MNLFAYFRVRRAIFTLSCRYDHKYHSSNRKGPSDLVNKPKNVHFLNRSPKNLRETPPDRYPKEVPSRRNELPEISRCDATYFHRTTQYTGSIRLFYSEFQLKNRDFCLFIFFFLYRDVGEVFSPL